MDHPTAARGSIAVPVLLVVAGLGLAACGGQSGATPATGQSAGASPVVTESNPSGDIPDTTVYVAYRPPSARYEVKAPEGWVRTESAAAVIFTGKLNSIRVETVRAATAPTVGSARSTEVPPIQAAGHNFALTSIGTVTRPAGTVVVIKYLTDSAPDPVTGKVVRDAVERYEYDKNGTEAVLTLSGPSGADNVDPWRIVTDSFRWLP
jgi:hypothetical protein